jgi:citrate lyase subunit beta-like protein
LKKTLDLDGLKAQSEQGARMGFTGKQVIHPGQVDIVQAAFMPSEAKIKWAKGLVEAFRSHQLSGRGAFTYEDQMIDMPTVLQAENVLAVAGKSN